MIDYEQMENKIEQAKQKRPDDVILHFLLDYVLMQSLQVDMLTKGMEAIEIASQPPASLDPKEALDKCHTIAVVALATLKATS